MQPVDVLGHNRVEPPAAFELGEDRVGAIRAFAAQRLEAVAVEPPETRGVAVEYVDVGGRHRVDVRP